MKVSSLIILPVNNYAECVATVLEALLHRTATLCQSIRIVFVA